MIFTASKGHDFTESFTFKNEKGQALTVPYGDYRVSLERGDFVKEYTNLRVQRNSIIWHITADETEELKYDTLYFVLTFNGTQVTRGVLRVQ